MRKRDPLPLVFGCRFVQKGIAGRVDRVVQFACFKDNVAPLFFRLATKKRLSFRTAFQRICTKTLFTFSVVLFFGLEPVTGFTSISFLAAVTCHGTTETNGIVALIFIQIATSTRT